jgi:putative Holliday junction resolvase
MLTTHKSVLGLDVGAKRIGVAVATLAARLPRPLATLEWNDGFFAALDDIVKSEGAGTLVVGFPRGLDGQHTAQTEAVEAFTAKLRQNCELPVHMQDEALTSEHAKAELEARGKPYGRGDVDALAATYILRDWLAEHREAQA